MGKSILILDEDGSLPRLLEPVLVGRGHEVCSATSTEEATRITKERGLSLDVAVVGEKLRDGDGVGWITSLRRENRDLKLVFVAASAKAQELHDTLTRELAVDLVVQRPLKLTAFAPQLEGIFEPVQIPVPQPSADATLEATLKALFDKYARVLPERVDALFKALDQAKSENTEPSLKEARRLAHNMKGTASSSGFENIGQQAGHIERALDLILTKEGDWQLMWRDIAIARDNISEHLKTDLKVESSSTRVETVNDDLCKARILVASAEPMPRLSMIDDALPIDLIQVSEDGDAIERARGVAIDAAIIDLGSRSDKPFKLARELRTLPSCENLPFGFISSASQPGDRIESTLAGGSVYLNKPLDAKSFESAVRYLLTVREGGRPRILLVDDDPDFSAIIAHTLSREGMLVKTLTDPTRTSAVMESYVPDLVLLDVNMPVIGGFEICRKIRGAARWQDTPIIFLTAETGLDARLNAFEAGGDDYLPKPVAEIELLTRVKVRLERSRLLKERTDRDVLTGLLLRRAFMEQLQSLEAEADRHNLRFCISLLDVDHFKKVNDTYGHLAGDRVLSYFGQLLKKRFRVEDLRGRWGGEEFILAFRHESKETMRAALTRVLDELAAVEMQGDHGEQFKVTFSAGMAGYPEDSSDLNGLLQVADKRLYLAKELGRKRVVVTDEG